MSYKIGYQKEYRALKFLEECGYTVVRSSGSHTLYDLIAIPSFDRSKAILMGDTELYFKVLLIQVKSNLSTALIAEYVECYETVPFSCEIQLWIMPKGVKTTQCKIIRIKDGIPIHKKVGEIFIKGD